MPDQTILPLTGAAPQTAHTGRSGSADQQRCRSNSCGVASEGGGSVPDTARCCRERCQRRETCQRWHYAVGPQYVCPEPGECSDYVPWDDRCGAPPGAEWLGEVAP